MQQHLEVGLVPQPLLGSERPGSCEVVFRQPDCDGGRCAGPLTRDSRHGPAAEFAGGFGLLEAIRDQGLIFRPPFGLLCLSLEGGLFLGHRDHLV
jgi:hypothetical protein